MNNYNISSETYLNISDKLISLYPKLSRELTLNLGAPQFTPSTESISEAILFFKSQTFSSYFPIFNKYPCIHNTFSSFIETALSNKRSKLNIENLKELLKLLSTLVLHNKFNKNTLSILAKGELILFFEAACYFSLCPNRFEQTTKTAAHRLIENITLNLYNLSDSQAALLTGALRSAWLFAQNTEGIRDKNSNSKLTTNFIFKMEKPITICISELL